MMVHTKLRGSTQIICNDVNKNKIEKIFRSLVSSEPKVQSGVVALSRRVLFNYIFGVSRVLRFL